MRRGIKATLYLPKDCLDKIYARAKEVETYLLNNFNIAYDFYEGEYNNEDVCGIQITLLNVSCKAVEADYSHFKSYIKQITGKTPKQVLMAKFDRI